MSIINRARHAGRVAARGLWLSVALAAPLGVAAVPTAASAAGYVSTMLGDVPADQKAVVAQPRPVQLLFQFRTKGAPNARGTKLLKDKVVDAVKASGLFSDVTDGPAADGAILNVVIDDVIAPKEMANAEAKGAVTGATMFIAGSNITEHYQSQIDYVAGPDAPKISRTAKHAVVFQMGLINSAPADAVKVEGGINAAVFTMARQIVANPLNDLAKDPAFLPAAPAAAAPAPTPAASTTTAAPATATATATDAPAATPAAPK